MTDPKFCPQCGQSNAATAIYCRNCGQELALSAAEEPATNTRRRVWIALFTYLIVVIGLLAFAWFVLWPRYQPTDGIPAANFKEERETVTPTPASLLSQSQEEGTIVIIVSPASAPTVPEHPPAESVAPAVSSLPTHTATAPPTVTQPLNPHQQTHRPQFLFLLLLTT